MQSATLISAAVLQRCNELGFAAVGICAATATDFQRELLDWLAAGKHGEMEYLRRNVELRIDPRAMVENAKSIIVVADRYSAEGVETSDAGASQFTGRIARYARGEDYHKVMRGRLANLCKELTAAHSNHTFRASVDTAPVLEREHAQRAGIGAVGKNTLIIERGVGSFLLLGEIITTLELHPSTPSEPDPCGSCTRCIDACPTSAITPWSVNATKCISYLTIEHRGEIDEQYHRAMGDWIFGCDICQDVCPHNQPTARTLHAPANPVYNARRAGFNLLDVLAWTDEARQQAFMGSSLKRAKLDMMKRNALIAAGNAIVAHNLSALHPLRKRIEELAASEGEVQLVRDTAKIVLNTIVARELA